MNEKPLKPVWKSECMNSKVDMVEVVRCKDCKYWNSNLGEYCEKLNSYPGPNYFCADGERMNEHV